MTEEDLVARYGYLVGMTIGEAAVAADGMRLRIVGDGDECYFVTMDYHADRINVTMREGVVASVEYIG